MTKNKPYEIEVSCDGSHWGLSDIYPQYAEQIKERLEKGLPFSMKYGSKKEICWCKLRYNGKYMQVEVTVSDDFDAAFTCSDFYEVTTTGDKYEEMQGKIGECWDKADNEARMNHPVQMYCVGNATGVNGKTCRADWLVTYNSPKDAMCADYPPPGEHYPYWGWDMKTDLEAPVFLHWFDITEFPYGLGREVLEELEEQIEEGTKHYVTKCGRFVMTKEL